MVDAPDCGSGGSYPMWVRAPSFTLKDNEMKKVHCYMLTYKGNWYPSALLMQYAGNCCPGSIPGVSAFIPVAKWMKA